MRFWDDKKPPKENFASKDDITKMQRDIEKLLKDKDQPDTRGATSKLVGSLAKGFGNVAKSLSTAQNKRRMRISQMVEGKHNPMRTTRVSNPIAGKNAGLRKRKISYAPEIED